MAFASGCYLSLAGLTLRFQGLIKALNQGIIPDTHHALRPLTNGLLLDLYRVVRADKSRTVGIPQRLVDILLCLGYLPGSVNSLQLRKCFEKAGSRLYDTFDTKRLKKYGGTEAQVYLSRVRTDCTQPAGVNTSTNQATTDPTAEPPPELGPEVCQPATRQPASASDACGAAHQDTAGCGDLHVRSSAKPQKVPPCMIRTPLCSPAAVCVDGVNQDSFRSGV
jgi:hypothetical protein